MKKSNATLLCMIFLMFSGSMHSQLPKDPITALSPNAASLGLYGDIPVSLWIYLHLRIWILTKFGG